MTRLITALALALPFALPATPASAACDVTVASFEFRPNVVQVQPGDTVTWCWTGDNHSVSGQSFDSHPTCPPTCGNTGDTFSHTFTGQPTTYMYICKVHSSMQGRVVVHPAATKTPAPTRTTAAPTTRPATRPPTTAPVRSTPPRTTPPPTTAAPTTAPATTVPPTTAPPTTPSAEAISLAPAPPAAEPPASKPRPLLAVVTALAVAALAVGGAVALWVRGRA